MECHDSLINNYSILISTISAFISALMAFLSNINANKSKGIAYAGLLSTHFYNVREILNYIHSWGGLSQDLLNEKKKSVLILKSMLPEDKELQGILSNIDNWLNRQNSIQNVIDKYDLIIKKHLGIKK